MRRDAARETGPGDWHAGTIESSKTDYTSLGDPKIRRRATSMHKGYETATYVSSDQMVQENQAYRL